MDIRNLNTFMQVAELGSFTKAARQLGYSQSTVSFQIRQLEEELKVSLFDRINHTVLLTEKGREVLEYAHRVDRMTMELKEAMQQGQRASGHIRLGMADSLCDSMLGKSFGNFREQYPGITLKIITAGTEEMFQLLDHNEVDAILTLDAPVRNREYRVVQQERVDVHFVAGVRAWPEEVSISLQELAKHPFILTEKGMSYRRLLDEKLAELSMEIVPVLEIGNTERICSLVEQGAGFSFLPDYVTCGPVRKGKLKRLPVEGFPVQVWKQLIHHRDKWVSPALESVLHYCTEREFSKASS